MFNFLTFLSSMWFALRRFLFSNDDSEVNNITLIDKIDGSGSNKREEYRRKVLNDVTTYR